MTFMSCMGGVGMQGVGACWELQSSLDQVAACELRIWHRHALLLVDGTHEECSLSSNMVLSGPLPNTTFQPGSCTPTSTNT